MRHSFATTPGSSQCCGKTGRPKPKFDGIFDTLRDVSHWLPIRQRIAYIQAECPDVQLSARRRTGLPA